MAHFEFHNNLLDISTIFYQSHADLIRNLCIEFDAVDRVTEFEGKYLDKLKLKPKKDPAKPKKPKTSYMFYCDFLRNDAKISEEIKNLKIGDQSKKFGSMWGKLNDEGKKDFFEKAEADKSRYEEEMQSYAYAK